MTKTIHIKSDSDKQDKYELLLLQLTSLLENESDMIANMGNISAALKEVFHFFWVGFYRVENSELVLAPFQGPIACTRIKYSKGVCGKAWHEKNTIIVNDVTKFSGHIACNAASRSEIVVPIFHNAEVVAVLDIDSEHVSYFDDVDAKYLREVVNLLRF